MPTGYLKRLIERASDSLARDVYQRILMDRRAAQGQLALHGTVPTWEDIAARAVEEAILTREEATEILAEVRKAGGVRLATNRFGMLGKRGSHQGVDRADDSREDASHGPSEKANGE